MLTDAAPVRGKYVPLARLATGGMAEILVARLEGAQGFEKLVVLKRLLPHLAEEERHVQMFLDEARTVARISHPNVCHVYELGEERGRYTIVMEYLEGVTASRVTLALPPQRGGFEARLVAELFRQACEGLHHAHELAAMDGTPAGLVHRDVSPQNLLVTLDGTVKVLDFGIAKTSWSTTRTRAGMILGKTAYMSPEQVRGRRLDRKSDLFSLGVVLHEMLVGQSLFRRDNDFLTYKAITEEPVPDVRDYQPGVPEALALVVKAALARDPAARPASARALGERIVDAVAPLGGPLRGAEVAAWMATQFGGELRERRARVHEAMQRRARAAAAPGVVEGAAPAALVGYADRESSELPLVPTDVEIVPPHMPPPGRTGASGGSVVTRDSDAHETQDARREEAGDEPEPPAPPRRRRVLVAVPLVFGALGVVLAVALGRGGARAPVPAASAAAAAAAAPDAAPAAAAAAAPAAAADAAPGPAPAPAPRRPHPPPDTRPGWMTIDSRPYATIFVDGRRIGLTPVVRLELAPGAHQVRAVTADGRQQRFRVVIEPARETPRRRLVW